MRTYTLFAVALSSFLINFSNAVPVAPVDGVLATVVPGGTGSLVGTAAKDGKQSAGGLLKKRDLGDDDMLDGDIYEDIYEDRYEDEGEDGDSIPGDRSDDRHGDRYDEFTKRSSMQERNLLGGLLGGGGGGGGGGGKKSKTPDERKAKSASAEKDSPIGGLPLIDGLLKRNILGGGLPVVGNLLGGGKSTNKNTVKQADENTVKQADATSGHGRGRVRAQNQKKVQPAAKEASGGGLPVVDGLLG